MNGRKKIILGRERMKKVMQRYHVHKENGIHGDCWESCILSITELDRELLPSVNDEKYKGDTYWQDFYMDMVLALEKYGWELTHATINGFEDEGDFVIASGDSPRGNGIKHAVVWNKGIVHDPHESNAGILNIDRFEILKRIN